MNDPPEALEAGDGFRFFSEVLPVCSPEDAVKIPAGERVSLVASASRYGLLFVAHGGYLQVLPSGTLSVPLQPAATVWCGGRITHVTRTADSLTVLVAAVWPDNTPHLLYYDLRTLLAAGVSGGAAPYMQCCGCNTAGGRLTAVSCSPTDPGCVALCTSTGDLTILTLGDTSINFNTKKGLGAGAVGWSAKGKQLCVGCGDGSLALFKPDLTPVRIIPPPPLPIAPCPATAITWFTNTEFFVGYGQGNTPSLVYVNAPKGKPAFFSRYDDVCYTNDVSRPHYYHITYVPDWNQVFVLSSGGVEMAVLVKEKERWAQMFLDEGNRAEMHFVNVTQETHPLGMTLDFSSIKKFTVKEDETVGPFPVFYSLSTGGELNVFHANNKLPDKPDLCAVNPVEKLPSPIGVRTAAQYKLNIAIPQEIKVAPRVAASPIVGSVASPPAAVAAAAPSGITAFSTTALPNSVAPVISSTQPMPTFGGGSAFGASTPLSSLPAGIGPKTSGGSLFGNVSSSSLFGGSPVATTTTTTPGGSLFGSNTSAFGGATSNVQSGSPFASATATPSIFGAKSDAGATGSVFGGAVSNASKTTVASTTTAAVNSGFSFAPPATAITSSTAMGSGGRIFSSLPSSGGSGTSMFSSPGGGGGAVQATASLFGGGQAVQATAASASSSTLFAPKTSGTPPASNTFAMSSTKTGIASSGSPAGIPTQFISPAPTTAVPSAQFTHSSDTIPASSLVSSKPVTPTTPTSNAPPSGVKMGSPVAVPTTDRTVNSPKILPLAGGESARHTPVREVQKSRTAQQNKALMDQILEEQDLFDKELQENFRLNDQYAYKGGWESGTASLQAGLRECEAWATQQTEETKKLSDDVNELHAAVLEFYAGLEDTRVTYNRLRDPRQAHIEEWRGLDRCSERRLQKLHADLRYVQSELAYANAALDAPAMPATGVHGRASRHTRVGGSGTRMGGSRAEDVYKTVLLTHNIRVACEKQLDKLASKMNSLNLFTSRTLAQLQLNDGPLCDVKPLSWKVSGSGVNDNLSDNKENVRQPLQDNDKLWQLLQQRNTTPVRTSGKPTYSHSIDGLLSTATRGSLTAAAMPPATVPSHTVSATVPSHTVTTTISAGHTVSTIMSGGYTTSTTLSMPTYTMSTNTMPTYTMPALSMPIHSMPVNAVATTSMPPQNMAVSSMSGATMPQSSGSSKIMTLPESPMPGQLINTADRSALSMSTFGPQNFSTPAEPSVPVSGSSRIALREQFGAASMTSKPPLNFGLKSAEGQSPVTSDLTKNETFIGSGSNTKATESIKFEKAPTNDVDVSTVPKYEDITPPGTPEVPNNVITPEQTPPRTVTNPLSALSSLVGKVPPVSNADKIPSPGFFSPTAAQSSSFHASSMTGIKQEGRPFHVSGISSGVPFSGFSSTGSSASNLISTVSATASSVTFVSSGTPFCSSFSAFTKSGTAFVVTTALTTVAPHTTVTQSTPFSFPSTGMFSAVSTTPPTMGSSILQTPVPSSGSLFTKNTPANGSTSLFKPPNSSSSIIFGGSLPANSGGMFGNATNIGGFGGTAATATTTAASLFNPGSSMLSGSTISAKTEPMMSNTDSVAATKSILTITSIITTVSTPTAQALVITPTSSTSVTTIIPPLISSSSSLFTHTPSTAPTGMFSQASSTKPAGTLFASNTTPEVTASSVPSPISSVPSLFGSLANSSSVTITVVTSSAQSQSTPSSADSVTITPVATSSTFNKPSASAFGQLTSAATTTTLATITMTTSGGSSLFGGTQSTLFAQSATSGNSSLFGASQVSTAPAFGVAQTTTSASSVFGTAPTSGGSLFGGQTSISTTSAFAVQAPSTSAFGTPAVGSFFGGTTTAPTSGVSTFGSSSVFGEKPGTSTGSVFGSSGSVFGGTTATTTTASVFGTSASSTFGTSNTPASTMFGANNSKTSMFGAASDNTASVFGAPATSNSNSTFGSTSGGSVFGSAGSSTSVFAPSVAASSGTSVFGGAANAGTFGSSGNSSGPSAFGGDGGGGNAGSLFGGGGGLFTGLGGKPASGAATKNIFGVSTATAAPQTDLFGGGGAPVASPPAAAPQQQASIFGGVAPARPTPGFGSAATFGAAAKFGSPAFGSMPSFGSSSVFGGASVFGGSPSNTQASSFGGGSFGAPPAAAGAGGSGFSSFANSSTATFGGLAATSSNNTAFPSGGSSSFGEQAGGAAPSGGGSSFTSWR